MGNLLVPWLFLVQTLVVVAISGAKVPAVIVFGDSSLDSGNNNFIPTIARSNFAPYGKDFPGGQATGRFCNGRIPSDMISEALGLKPTVPAYLDPMYNISDFAVGVCFASAGTGYDNTTSDVVVSTPTKMYLINPALAVGVCFSLLIKSPPTTISTIFSLILITQLWFM